MCILFPLTENYANKLVKLISALTHYLTSKYRRKR